MIRWSCGRQRTKDGYHEGALTDLEEAIGWDNSYPDAFDERGSIAPIVALNPFGVFSRAALAR